MTSPSHPQSEVEFIAHQSEYDYLQCLMCEAAFSSANTHSRAGWMETQISGLCEDCFDLLTAEDREGEEDHDRDIPF